MFRVGKIMGLAAILGLALGGTWWLSPVKFGLTGASPPKSSSPTGTAPKKVLPLSGNYEIVLNLQNLDEITAPLALTHQPTRIYGDHLKNKLDNLAGLQHHHNSFQLIDNEHPAIDSIIPGSGSKLVISAYEYAWDESKHAFGRVTINESANFNRYRFEEIDGDKSVIAVFSAKFFGNKIFQLFPADAPCEVNLPLPIQRYPEVTNTQYFPAEQEGTYAWKTPSPSQMGLENLIILEVKPVK